MNMKVSDEPGTRRAPEIYPEVDPVRLHLFFQLFDDPTSQFK